jgi:hypothetical protein
VKNSPSQINSSVRHSEQIATLIANDNQNANFDLLPELSKSSKAEKKLINNFVLQKQMILRFVRDSIAEAVDVQKEQADKKGRKNSCLI